jgi:uncharacterized membrane protein YdbT with pleckstrin-like domain
MRAYLEPGERIQFEARPHGVALVRPLTRAFALALVGSGALAAGAQASWPLAGAGVVVLAAGAAVAFAAVWRWDRTKLVLTTDKLFVVHGIARRRAAAVRLARVGPVEVDQSLAGRILDYGTVVAGELEIPYVPSPGEICRLAR